MNIFSVIFFFFFFQLKVIAYDSAAPTIKGTSNVEITVRRNVNSPGYIGTPYSKSVSELHPLGEAVINITATDNDRVCILLPFDWLKISPIKKNSKMLSV